VDGDLLASVPAVNKGKFPLVLYDEMCRAIDLAYQVDEAKDIRDRALAFEVYARQAKNIDAERRACEVRLRAERKAGKILREQEKAKGAAEPGTNRGSTRSPNGTASLAELGVSKKQSSDWQRLAEMPQELFEQALADPDRKPTTAGIIASATPPKSEVVPVSDQALWLWGRLRDFDRDLLQRVPSDVLLTMTPEMLDDTHQLAPRVAAWLSQIGRTQ